MVDWNLSHWFLTPGFRPLSIHQDSCFGILYIQLGYKVYAASPVVLIVVSSPPCVTDMTVIWPANLRLHQLLVWAHRTIRMEKALPTLFKCTRWPWKTWYTFTSSNNSWFPYQPRANLNSLPAKRIIYIHIYSILCIKQLLFFKALMKISFAFRPPFLAKSLFSTQLNQCLFPQSPVVLFPFGKICLTYFNFHHLSVRQS